MGDDTKIQWTDATWNPVRGCSRVSEGCRNCYAEGVAARFSGPGLAYEGLARRTASGEPRWTGKLVMVDEHLDDPIRWKKPRRIFVNSMSDLFHEKLTEDEIEKVFGVMLNAPRHTYQILTKRAERMRKFVDAFCEARGWDALPPFIHLGVSTEDQPNFDARAPHLLATRAAVRFISAEPLLGPIAVGLFWVDWVIVGGESGRNARTFDIAWARSIRDQCKAAGVACFVKQLGARPIETGEKCGDPACATFCPHAIKAIGLKDGHGGHWDEWPEDLRVREFPKGATT